MTFCQQSPITWLGDVQGANYVDSLLPSLHAEAEPVFNSQFLATPLQQTTAKLRSPITILLFLLSLFLGFQLELKAQNTETFTIYLVRHSEKDVSGNHDGDPPLTECGTERSEHLSNFFSAVPLEAVYSTDYTRTKNTALPTAWSQKLELQNYSPSELEAFAKLLKTRKQDALVVGHSNTTAVLAGMLAGKELGAYDESIYNRIYQVVIHKKKGRLHLFHTAFDCENQ